MLPAIVYAALPLNRGPATAQSRSIRRPRDQIRGLTTNLLANTRSSPLGKVLPRQRRLPRSGYSLSSIFIRRCGKDNCPVGLHPLFWSRWPTTATFLRLSLSAAIDVISWHRPRQSACWEPIHVQRSATNCDPVFCRPGQFPESDSHNPKRLEARQPFKFLSSSWECLKLAYAQELNRISQPE